MNNLHVYAQTEWHTDAFIVGDMKSLKDLRDAINQVLETGNPARMESMVNDGEGYWLYVINHEEMDNMAVPYTSDIAAEQKTNIWPENIIYKEMHILEEGQPITPTAKNWPPEKLDAFVELIRKS